MSENQKPSSQRQQLQRYAIHEADTQHHGPEHSPSRQRHSVAIICCQLATIPEPKCYIRSVGHLWVLGTRVCESRVPLMLVAS